MYLRLYVYPEKLNESLIFIDWSLTSDITMLSNPAPAAKSTQEFIIPWTTPGYYIAMRKTSARNSPEIKQWLSGRHIRL